MCNKLQKANSFTSSDNEDGIAEGKHMPSWHVQNKSGDSVICYPRSSWLFSCSDLQSNTNIDTIKH